MSNQTVATLTYGKKIIIKKIKIVWLPTFFKMSSLVFSRRNSHRFGTTWWLANGDRINFLFFWGGGGGGGLGVKLSQKYIHKKKIANGFIKIQKLMNISLGHWRCFWRRLLLSYPLQPSVFLPFLLRRQWNMRGEEGMDQEMTRARFDTRVARKSVIQALKIWLVDVYLHHLDAKKNLNSAAFNWLFNKNM